MRGSIVSKGGSCLLLLVSISRPTKPSSAIRGAWDHGYLLRITKTSDGRFRAKKVMDRAKPFMSQRHRGVSELGAVSDDGSSALIKFSEADADEAPYRMSYAWQTWDLDTPKKLSDGLTLDNAKKPWTNRLTGRWIRARTSAMPGFDFARALALPSVSRLASPFRRFTCATCSAFGPRSMPWTDFAWGAGSHFF